MWETVEILSSSSFGIVQDEETWIVGRRARQRSSVTLPLYVIPHVSWRSCPSSHCKYSIIPCQVCPVRVIRLCSTFRESPVQTSSVPRSVYPLDFPSVLLVQYRVTQAHGAGTVVHITQYFYNAGWLKKKMEDASNLTPDVAYIRLCCVLCKTLTEC